LHGANNIAETLFVKAIISQATFDTHAKAASRTGAHAKIAHAGIE
jgi:hypothetical protein